MTRLISSLTITLLTAALAVGCQNAVPQVSKSKHDPVIPPGPQRQVQALSSPDTTSAEGSSSNADSFCDGGVQTAEEYDAETGAFSNTFTCNPGGGIASITNAGLIDPVTGDGGYDQTTQFEDGETLVWHFTVDSSDDFTVQTYSGNAEDGSETYTGSYSWRASDGDWDVVETWNMAEGTYVIDGVQSADGTEFAGDETFDDPSTEASPDWSLFQETHADGTFLQEVSFVGDGFTSDYSYELLADGSADYSFETDMTGNAVSPDFEGAYHYNADGFSGEGDYLQHFEDASLLNVHDVINADGTVVESWTFDDASTDIDVDQEGSMTYALDGSAEGTFTTHSDEGSVTCEVHLSAAGEQTIDHCDE